MSLSDKLQEAIDMLRAGGVGACVVVVVLEDGSVVGARPEGNGVGAMRVVHGQDAEIALALAASTYPGAAVVAVPVDRTAYSLNAATIEAAAKHNAAEIALKLHLAGLVRAHLRSPEGKRAVADARVALDVGEPPPTPKWDLGDDLQSPPLGKGDL